MAKNHYSDVSECKLSEFITPDIFRTVLYEQLDVPGGITEVPVEITLKKDAAKKLSFKIPADGILYGFARIRSLVQERFGAETVKVYINDWEVKFVLVFELDTKQEKAFYITESEVIELLENCIRVPQQHSIKKKHRKEE